MNVIGAGLGRTGTHSLKLALETLNGAPCYHMAEVFDHPEDIAVWQAAASGEAVDWRALMDGYHAAVDWPASAFWRELAAEYPDAKILLSHRDPEEWWESASATIFAFREGPPEMAPFHEMVRTLFASKFTADIGDKDACIAAFNRHNDAVRREADPSRLVEWRVGDGWAPLCEMIGVDIPSEPFPRSNSREEFIGRATSHQAS